MAVIRCPKCGKPNPDFLEACQYCDEPLREGGTPASESTVRKSLIIRCPNCDKPNPEFVTRCQFCDTPLKGVAGAPAAEPEPEPEPESNNMPDWLRALRGEAPASDMPFQPSASEATHDWEWTGTAEPEPAPAAPAEAVPDWLKSLQGEAEPAAPAEDVPDWLKSLQTETPAAADAVPADAVPDWLKSGPQATPAATPPAQEPQPAAAPADEMPDWLRSFQPGAPAPETTPEPAAAPADDVPDWLKSMQGETPAAPAVSEPAAAAPAPQPAAADEMPDWLRAMQPAAASASVPEAAPGELPDWLKKATGPLESPAESPSSDLPGELPDWLKGATGPLPATPAEAPAAAGEMPDWLSGLPTADAGGASTPQPAVSLEAPLSAVLSEEAEDLPPVDDEQPDWLKSLGLAASAEAAVTAPLPAQPAADEPDWMRTLRAEPGAAAEPEAAPAEAEPDWLSALRTEPGASSAGEAPAVSPFAAEPAAGGNEPDWLAGLRPTAPVAESAAPAFGAESLAQAELPTWLAAMRPMDVQRPALEPEVDDYQETVGILAGMRGVLRAEPSVVLPGKSAVQVHALAFDQAQAKQAEILAGILLGDKAAPAAQRKPRLAAVPWERWLVAIVLLAGMLGLPFGLPGLFALPTTLPAETLAAFHAVEAAPAGKPVLVAFDYEPGQAGELGLLAEALVGHVVRRGLPVAAVSTSLTGAGLAQETLRQVTAGTAYSDTETYLNLGYLAGGPLGIRQWAYLPQMAVRADFTGRGGVWARPMLQAVTSLDSFGLVIVISAAPDDARAWLEQTQGFSTPVILAVSAGSAPVVRTYWEAEQASARADNRKPRIAGLVNGVAGAMQYQAQAGIYQTLAPEAVQLRWEMIGSGLVMALLLLVLGNLVHGARSALRKGKS